MHKVAGLSAVTLLVLVCWVPVIGHQLGIGSFDPVRYVILRGFLPLAYTVTGLSVCVIGVIIVGMAVKR